MPEETRYGVVLLTTPSRAEGEKIASVLVETQLAACVSLTPVYSVYSWQGKIHRDEEWQLIIKTDLAKFDTVAAKVQELHSYEVPEIVALPIVAGLKAYLQWIAENVS
ncbi:MAG: divalent-cation tolerance protein CutA [Cyanophyceae cyanobacterium]